MKQKIFTMIAVATILFGIGACDVSQPPANKRWKRVLSACGAKSSTMRT